LELAVSEMRSQGRRIFIGSLRDLTSTKRIAEALRQSEARFRDFAEIVSDWFWEQDENHRFSYMSPSFELKTGIRVEDVLGRKREDVIAFASAAARQQWEIEQHRRVIVGVNEFVSEEDALSIPLLKIDEQAARDQAAKLAQLRASRDNALCTSRIDALREAARGKENVVPYILECARAYCTLFEIRAALEDVFGAYREPVFF
ncbi:PAS domain S-box protein, partial [bacterium]|nr:PAS domain S-box protein [bacterium]